MMQNISKSTFRTCMKHTQQIIWSLSASIIFLVLLFLVQSPRPPAKFSGAMQALQFWNEQRAYPNGHIDDKQFYSAFTALQSEKILRRSSVIVPDQWRQIGPHNIGGRTLAVAVNPQNTKTIFAGSASGGLWRSYNEGKGAAAWHPVKTGFPVLSVSSIAIAPNDSNIMFIGTGEVYNQYSSIGGLSIRTTRGSYGIGLLKTTDGGVSWKSSLDWKYAEMRGVQSVKIHPVFINHVWAATTEGIFHSADTGTTWKNLSDVPMGTDLVLDPLDTNIVLAAHGNLGSVGAGIYRTLDGGTTWNQSTAGLPVNFGGKIVFAQYRSSPNVIYASIGNGAVSGTWLCRSTDYGFSWSVVSTKDYSTYQGWYSHCVGVKPDDSSKIICGGIDIWKSTDGGLTLTKRSDWSAWYFGTPMPGEPEGPPNYSHADHHSITYHPENSEIIYFGTDGGIFCSTDGGETFEGRNGGYQTTQFYNGFSSARLDSHLAIGGMQDNATAIYEGGVAWRRVIGGDGVMTAMSPTSLDTMYGSSQNLNLYRSSNRFKTFSSMPVPSGSVTNFVGPFALSESNPRILYAGRDKVYKTTNSGVQWTATNGNQSLDGNPVLAIAVAPTHSDTVYATTTPRSSPAKMFRTTNGGLTWTNITGVLPDRYLVDIAVDPTDASVVYVTASGFGTPHLYTTTNAGMTWSDIGNGLPDVPTSAVTVDPYNTNHIYLGNDLGVFVSTNRGNSWIPFSEGLFDATMIMDLSVSRMNRSLRAVTHGNGVFERKWLDGVTGVKPEPAIAFNFELEQNFPNPFNPMTKIRFHITEKNHVLLSIYDIEGKETAVLVNGERNKGVYSVVWDASKVSSGIYFAQLTINNKTLIKKMVLLK